MNGIEVIRMVVFLPRASSNDPPISPPAKAAKGIKLPIQEASYLVTYKIKESQKTCLDLIDYKILLILL